MSLTSALTAAKTDPAVGSPTEEFVAFVQKYPETPPAQAIVEWHDTDGDDALTNYLDDFGTTLLTDGGKPAFDRANPQNKRRLATVCPEIKALYEEYHRELTDS